MKHVIIGGAPRAGKTTLSRELTYGGYVHYRLDSIKRAVFDIFCPNNKDWHLASTITRKIIDKLIDDNEQESLKQEYFIFDTPHLYPEDVKDLDKDKILIVFLGYAYSKVDEKVENILKYDAKTCWTHKIPISRLRDLVDGNIKFSREIQKQCSEYKIPYFDVSYNRNDILEEVREYIRNTAFY